MPRLPAVDQFSHPHRRIRGRFRHQPVAILVGKRPKIVEAVSFLREIFLHERELEGGVQIVDDGSVVHGCRWLNRWSVHPAKAVRRTL